MLITAQMNVQSCGALKNLASGLRINGRSQEEAAARAAENLAAAAEEALKAAGEAAAEENPETAPKPTTENFASEMLRLCRGNNRRDGLGAEILADSLVNTANEVRKQFGSVQAEKFMSGVMNAEFTEPGLGEAIGGFFRRLSAETGGDAGLLNKVSGLRNFLNKDRAMVFHEAKVPGRFVNGESLGLAYALNRFFDSPTKINKDQTSGEALGFNADFRRVKMAVSAQDDDDLGMFIIYSGKTINAGQLDDKLKADLAGYLRGANENAAAVIEAAGDMTNFMESISTAVSIVLAENGQSAAEGLVDYLNKNIKPAIDSLYSEVDFGGWRLSETLATKEKNAEWMEDGWTALWFASPKIAEDGHQEFTVRWRTTSSGAGFYKGTDMENAYAAWLAAGGPGQAAEKGSMVDIQV